MPSVVSAVQAVPATGSVSIHDIGDGLRRTQGAEVDLAFRMQGTGPALVLLHGTSANHAVWQPVSDLLAKQATVIALDQRGHGRSDKPFTGYTGPDFAADIITVLDALGIERAVVAGHSLGGRNAWLAAASYPTRISRAVVVDYTPFVESNVLDQLQQRVALGNRAFRDVAEIESYLAERYPAILPCAVVNRARWGYQQLDDGSWLPLASPPAMTQLIDGFRAPFIDEFCAVGQPMVHLRGEASRIVSETAWQSAKQLRPDDRWVDVDEADHYIPEIRPDLVAAEIARVLPFTDTES